MLLVAAVFLSKSDATSFPTGMRADTINSTILTASGTTTTNKVGTGLYVEGVLNHSFQCVNSGAAAQQFIIDWSLDNTNFVPISTNAVAATSTAGITSIGKYAYVRARQLGTNDAMAVIYLGGN